MVFLRKLTSRKFLAAIAGIVAGIAMVFGLDEDIIAKVAGAVTTAASVVSYILAEGAIDKKSVETFAEIEIPDEQNSIGF